MTNLVRWDPFDEMTSLRDAMNQLVAESFVRPRGIPGMFQPPIDLYETANEYVVKLATPGLKSDNFEITAQENTLTIRGRTQDEEQQDGNQNGQQDSNQNGGQGNGKQGVRYHVREQRFGEFVRIIQFPTQIDADKIQANLAQGILTIQVPKAEAAKPKRIAVQAAQ
jgi:HSP20 family protein